MAEGDNKDLSFIYSVDDGSSTVQQTATLRVAGINDAPVAESDRISLEEDTVFKGKLRATDLDDLSIDLLLPVLPQMVR